MRKKLAIPAFFALLSLLFWGRFLWGPNALFHDVLFRLFYPYAVFFKNCLRGGEFPFWNPYIYTGVPFLANMQSAVLYPFTYVYLIFDFARGLGVLIFIHTTLGGIFMYLLSRDEDVSRIGSLLAGTLFAFSGFMTGHAAYPSHFQSAAWAPLVVLLVKKTQRGDPDRWFALAATAFALQILAGHPQFVFYTLVAVLICSPSKKLRPFVAIVAIFVTACLITLPQLGPTLDLAVTAPRAESANYEWATTFSLRPGEFLRMLFWPQWCRYFVPTSGDPQIVGFYVGWATIFAALFARGKRATAYLITMLVGALFSFGSNLPGYGVLFDVFFPLKAFRFPAQILFLFTFGISMLAGMGLDQLSWRPKMKWMLLGAVVVDLWLFSLRWVPTMNADFYRAETPATTFLKKQTGFFRVMMTPLTRRELGRGGENALAAALKFQDSLLPNLGMAHGVFDADGYEELRPAVIDQILNEAAKTPLSPWLDMLSVRYLISFWDDVPKKKWKLAFKSSVYLIENKTPWPRAFFSDTADPRSEKKNTTRVVNAQNNRIDLEVTAPNAGWVVLTDAFDDGWSATVNGAQLPVERVNVLQRAVEVPAGASRIEMKYRPIGFSFYVFVSLLTLALLVGQTVRKLSGIRRRPNPN